MTTLKDVAQIAGVSTATVSYVLTGKKHVSSEIENRIHAAVRQTGYQPNRAARALRTGRTHSLGLIVPDIANPFFPALAQAIEERARREGYALVLIDATYNPEAELQGLAFLEQHSVDGLIWVPSSETLPRRDLPFPAVILDHPTPGFSTICADDQGGGRMQARHAIQLKHERVALLSGPQRLASARERRRGFIEGAQGALTLVLDLHAPFTLKLPREVEQELIARRGEYSFLACGNDNQAVAAMRLFRNAGISVPSDVSVIGFDNNMLAEIVDPGLTTIEQPIREIGSLAVEMALEAVRGKTASEDLIVPVRLNERGSTTEFGVKLSTMRMSPEKRGKR
jgi:LacI family transcriptional regulator